MKIGIITQARMTSTRLPGKVLMKIAGKPLLHYHAVRSAWSGIPLYVATTVNKEDDCLVRFCEEHKLPYFRGSEADVLERYYQCATENGLDVIVRVTSDCPLVDGHLLRTAVDRYLQEDDLDVYLSNYLERTYPRGFDFEVFSYRSLKDAYRHASRESHREHVTPYINQNISGKVRYVNMKREGDASRFRITVDTPEDFALLKEMIERHGCAELGAEEIIRVLESNPHLYEINAHVQQKPVE